MAKFRTSSQLLISRLTFQLYMTDYLYERNVLTIGGKDGDWLAAPGLQADFSAIYAGTKNIHLNRAECGVRD
jgi:hypothetical protein